MATDKTGLGGLAGRYAAALYDLAETAGTLDAVAGDLRNLRELLAESPDLRHLIASPVLGSAEQARGIAAVVERVGVADLTRRFVGVLAQNRRLFALGAIIEAYLAQLAERRGEVAAHVASAAPLTETQLARVTETLRRTVGAKVVLELKVDPTLIGGLVVQVGSKLIDNSLRTKLMRLQTVMKGVA